MTHWPLDLILGLDILTLVQTKGQLVQYYLALKLGGLNLKQSLLSGLRWHQRMEAQVRFDIMQHISQHPPQHPTPLHWPCGAKFNSPHTGAWRAGTMAVW